MARTKPKTPTGPELLRKWRVGRKLNQAEACPFVGLDPATYSAFESGRKLPGLKRAAKIAAGTSGAVPIESWVSSSGSSASAA